MLDVTLALVSQAPSGRHGHLDDFERIGGEVVWEGQHRQGPRRSLPLRRRRGGRARDRRRTPARPGSSRMTARRSASCASRARPSATPTCSSCRPASSTRRARTRSTRPSASWPRRSARAPRTGSTSRASTPRPASRTRSATSSSPRTSTTRKAEADEDERIEIVEVPLADLDGVIARLPRLQDARSACSGCGPRSSLS